MGAATARKMEISIDSGRRHGRMDLSVPVDVLPLNHSSTNPVPARSLNVSEGGLSTIVAGEFAPFELVNLEFRLPDVGIPLRTRAWVRHQSALRCGFEFAGLSHQQRSMIRYWLERSSRTDSTDVQDASQNNVMSRKSSRPDTRSFWRLFALLGAMIVVLSAALAVWYWQSEWTKIEQNLPGSQASSKSDSTTPVEVPATAMEKLLVHRVDPVYPDAARAANLSGLVTLRIIVERDGQVSQLTVLSGAKQLQGAALDAVKWWRFQPYLVSGRPMRVQTTLAVDFKP
jgi:TonB family protein